MSDNPFDRHIKNSLRDYKSPVPNGMFEKIMEESTRLKKPLPFWQKNNFKLSAVLLTLFAIYLINHFIVGSKFSNSSSVSKKIANNFANSKTDSGNVYGKIISNQSELSLGDSVQFTNKREYVSQEAVSKASSDDNFITNKEINKEITIAIKKKMPLSFDSNDKVSSTKNLNKKVVTKKDSPFFLPSQSEKKNKPSIVSKSEDNATLGLVTDSSSTSTDIKEKNWKSLGYQDIIRSFTQLENTNLINSKPLMQTNTTTTISLKDIRKGQWFVEGYGSLDFNTKNIQAPGFNTDYLRMKDSSHQLTTGYSGGIKIGKRFGQYLALKIGLQYKQINERFEYISQNVSKSSSIITTRTFLNDIGQTLSLQDTSYLSQLGYSVKKVNNSYKNIEIPLTVGYEKKYKKLTVGINLGIIANIQSYYKGQTFDTSYQITSLGAKNGTGFYKSQSNLSLFGSAQLLYQLPHHIELFTEPYLRISIGNSSISDIGYNQRFNGMGISTGLRFSFPGKSNKK